MRLRIGQRARSASAALGVVMLAGMGFGIQCTSDPSVSCEIDLPAALSSKTQWLEVGVLPAPCPPSVELAGGLPPSGLVTSVAFQMTDTIPPAIGTLKAGSYAFAAVARASDCSVLATGCTQVNVTNARDVSIPMTASASPAGACNAGETCFDARCVPTLGNADAANTGCSMTLVGAGPLGDPLTGSSEIVSAPGVAATGSGFLIAYREYDNGVGAARLTLANVDPSGGLTIATPTMLENQCAGQDESDAVGFDFVGGAGVVVSARPSCATQSPGIDAFQVATSGTLGQTIFTSLSTDKPVLSKHALSLVDSTHGFLAYVGNGQANVVGLSALFPQGAPVIFDPVTSPSLAAVAASSQGLALLAIGTAGGDAAAAPTFDVMLAASPAMLGTPTSFQGTWGAIALAGTRAIALSDSSVSTQPLAWHTVDPPPGVPASATFASGSGDPGSELGGDVAVRDDLSFFAAEQAGAISLDVFSHASTTPTLSRALALAADPRVPSLAGVRDGKVAVAASSSQVLVAWVRGTMLGLNEPVGAWALYSCGP
jgi:hypothetical protein